MIMDLGHSAKRTDFVFFEMPPPRPATVFDPQTDATRSAVAFACQTPKRVRVRWYRAPEGALPIPGGSCWGSTDWLNIYELAETTMGEVPRTGTSRGNRLGLAPIGVTGQRYCGRKIDFMRPKVWNPAAPIAPRGPSGVLLCCNPALGGAVAFCGVVRSKGAVGLVAPEAAKGGVGLGVSISSAIGSVGLVEHLPASDNVGLTETEIEFATVAIGGDPPASEDVELASWDGPIPELTPGEVGLVGSAAAGDVGLVEELPASDDVGLVEDLPASDDVGLASWLGPLPYPVVAGDVGLVGNDAAEATSAEVGLAGSAPAGDVGLASVSATPPDPPVDGQIGLGGGGTIPEGLIGGVGEFFTASMWTAGAGSFVAPAPMVRVTLWAACGGSAANAGPDELWGGSGGGACCIKTFSGLTVGDSYPYDAANPTTFGDAPDAWFIDPGTMKAAGGKASTDINGALGGDAADCIGDFAWSGGDGGHGGDGITVFDPGGGGGGAGNLGDGGDGGDGAGGGVPGIGGAGGAVFPGQGGDGNGEAPSGGVSGTRPGDPGSSSSNAVIMFEW